MAGRTLNNVKPDLRFAACHMQFFWSKISSNAYCHYDYLSAPDRDGESRTQIVNIKYVWFFLTSLIFKTLDCLWRVPAIANESEQTCHESREHLPYCVFSASWTMRRGELKSWKRWVKYRAQISLLVILSIIIYIKNILLLLIHSALLRRYQQRHWVVGCQVEGKN